MEMGDVTKGGRRGLRERISALRLLRLRWPQIKAEQTALGPISHLGASALFAKHTPSEPSGIVRHAHRETSPFFQPETSFSAS